MKSNFAKRNNMQHNSPIKYSPNMCNDINENEMGIFTRDERSTLMITFCRSFNDSTIFGSFRLSNPEIQDDNLLLIIYCHLYSNTFLIS